MATRSARAVQFAREFELDAQPGLPETLPDGERILWQGSPDVWGMARGPFHVAHVAYYFAFLLVWRILTDAYDGTAWGASLAGLGWSVALAGFALGALALMGLWSARTTVYTLTDKRLVMRIGIVLTVAYNIPLTRIEAADIRRTAGDCNDLVLTLERGTRIAWLHLWPHVLPWRVGTPRPMLRALTDAPAVATQLAQAWGRVHGQAALDVGRVHDFVDSESTPLHPGHPAQA
jgi:hypothetical protein